jgi:protoporphyrinogen/coproporphyrinogen III oxidase
LDVRRIAVVGGGIAGVTAAWELARLARAGAEVSAVLFEATGRLGGIVETVREGGFTLECGADGWVTEKPWARELAVELGMEAELIASEDATRKTYVLLGGSGEARLVALPDGMRMMVPADMAALERSEMFSEAAKAAYRGEIARAEELKAGAPARDESVAAFVRRHFGAEVLEKIGAPLLSGVFGGDVETLSVRAVMAPFVAMERESGSLILGLQARAGQARASVFTSLKRGGESLIEAMVAGIPAEWVRRECPVLEVERAGAGWRVRTAVGWEAFDGLMMAAPADEARRLLEREDARSAELMAMEASSAVVAGFGFAERFALPQGFGFLVPGGDGASALLAGTFVDQKFAGRAPEGGRALRGFFGGVAADGLMGETDEAIAALALAELEGVLKMKLPKPVLRVVRRWPRSLPQYAVGHLERMEELFERVRALGGLWLLGNGYRGVGLPDLVRDARVAARATVRA